MSDGIFKGSDVRCVHRVNDGGDASRSADEAKTWP